MIYLLMIFTTCISGFLSYFFYKQGRQDAGEQFGIITVLALIVAVGFTVPVVASVMRANLIQAQIQLMQPSSLDEAKLKRAEMELKTVSSLIQETFAKYQIQAKTEDFKNIKMYAMPFAGAGLNFEGLGNIEKGAGEKLKNLETLIDKQWQLAEKIIELQALVYKPEFYSLNHELHALKYSVFDGVVVRWLLRDIKPVYNTDTYANGVQINH